MKIICFPHAGGFSNYYRFMQKLPSPTECILFEYPSRGKKARVPYPKDMQDMTRYVAEELNTILRNDESCVLFGHSMGAFVAYESARILKGRVKLMIVSGQTAPDRFGGVQIDCDSRADVLNYILSMGGSSSDLFRYPQAEEFFLPIVQNDLRLVSDYKAEPLSDDEKPDSVAVLCGTDDTEVNKSDLSEWKQCAKNFCGVKYFDGGHFYMNTQTEAFLAHIIELLKEYT